ncbi:MULTISPECIES: DUF945 family protein [unclassified Vibrio]|uniref:DUF945 family protein n=1 Tax=unclassified Vibrio TaxID=2614977 RepID=UPI000B8E73B6|nr:MULTISPECIES: DUF945 family protein [unclassified Vibrio]NAX44868.1 DUF945 family protein [Vibrio sp. V25_P4S6T154]OXX49838.1 hypothetical protein B9J93_01680 [Vibrio sp. V17_P4S1T151]OXX59256.1 hypothetical protein B9J89_19935 [Vibrio sp. V15_P4S5T153]OXX67168.1 hypothetical protein B9J94_11110 [Vibrio sp. V20_P4S3T152]
MKQLKIIGAVGGAIVLAACWPLAVGQIGEKVITNGIANISSGSIEADIVSYKRGYLSSTVQTRYQIADKTLKQQFVADGLPTQVLVNSEVKHGLLSLTATSVIADQENLPLTMTSITQLNGNTQYTVALDSWHYQSEDGEMTFSTTPATLKGDISVLGEITYQLNVPSVELDFTSGEKMMLSQLTGQGIGKQDKVFWLGQQSLALAKINLVDGLGENTLSMDNMRYSFDSVLKGEPSRFDSNHLIEMDKLTYSEGEVKDLNLDFTLGDLDGDAFEKLSTLYQNSPELSDEDIQQALPYVQSLFEKGFYLSMNKMALKVGQGEFESNWKIAVPEGTNNVVQDPSTILPALTGHIDTFISNQLVEDFPFIQQGIDELVVMEIMQQTDQGYRLQAELKQGNLEFENGNQMPLLTLLLPALMR